MECEIFKRLGKHPRIIEYKADFADIKTDIFILGLTIYHIMTSYRPFSPYNTIADEAKFDELYRKGEFPMLEMKKGGGVIKSC